MGATAKMKLVWNSLFLRVGKTLPFSFFVLLTAMSVVIAEPVPSAPEAPPATPPNSLIQTTPEPAPPAEATREQKLIEADRLYRQGQRAEAEALYRAVKDPVTPKTSASKPADPIVDPARLAPGGQVYWREFQTGQEKKLETRTLVPLNLLVKQYPQFIPGHLRLAVRKKR